MKGGNWLSEPHPWVVYNNLFVIYSPYSPVSLSHDQSFLHTHNKHWEHTHEYEIYVVLYNFKV